VTEGVERVIQILIANGIIESASKPEPTVETIFINVKPSLAK
jgi:hypothetical protein